jgi:hypothetical protein
MRQETESPIDDLTYDVITVLQNKAKALEAYDKYIRDAELDPELKDLFEQMRAEDVAHVRVLKEALARRLDDELGLDDDDDFVGDDDEDYDDDDEAEVEEPSGESTAEGDRSSPPRRGESTHRRV